MKKLIYFLLLIPALSFSQSGLQYGDGTGRATGNITTQNLNPLTGVPTAGSFVRLDLANQAGASVSVSGTYTGALSFQFSTDGGSTWVTTTDANKFILQTNVTPSATIASAAVGSWIVSTGHATNIRVTALAAVTGTAVVTIRAQSDAIINYSFLLPGTNIIGALVANQSVNVSQMNGVAVSMGNGVSGTGVQRVAIASDNTSNTNPFLIVNALPESVNDVASAAITTTATTAAFTPTRGQSYQIVMPVTVVSGTTPTLDLSVEESDDAGTNWYTVYQFPRITATGIYRSPRLSLNGNRVRYVQTIAGTTPSFTRAINRLQSSDVVPVYRQIVDRSISLTTLNSATPPLIVAGAINFTMTLKLGAATTPPTLQLEGSDDGGLTYYSIGVTLVGVASSSVSYTVSGISPTLVRARVSVVGATVTADNLLIRAF